MAEISSEVKVRIKMKNFHRERAELKYILLKGDNMSRELWAIHKRITHKFGFF